MNFCLVVLSLKGIKWFCYELLWMFLFGLEDEYRIYKYFFGVVLDFLFMRCWGSIGSLDSIGFIEFIDSFCNWSRGNRNLRGVEFLKDIGFGKEIVNSFKFY